MVDIWKPIILDDIQERYAVSDKGVVLDLKNHKILNQNDNGAGYMSVALMGPNSKLRVRYVHRLVAGAFIPNPEGFPQVGHKDHTRGNNVEINLYWTTQKNNTRDGILAGRINSKKRPDTKRLTPSQVCEIAKLSCEGYGVNEIAIHLGFSRTTISSVFNKRSNWDLFSMAMSEIKGIG